MGKKRIFLSYKYKWFRLSSIETKMSFSSLEKVMSCADFLELSCDELKFFLMLRGYPVSGNKLDLAARAFRASELKEPVNKNIQELEAELKRGYAKVLKDYGISDPKGIDLKNWRNDVSTWPMVDLGKFFRLNFCFSQLTRESDVLFYTGLKSAKLFQGIQKRGSQAKERRVRKNDF